MSAAKRRRRRGRGRRPRGVAGRRRRGGRRRWLAAAATIVLLAAGAVGCWWIPPAGIDELAGGPPPARWATWDWVEEAASQPGVEVRHTYRPLAQISVDLQVAVIVAEDIDFLGHQGFDWRAVREALDAWWNEGEQLRGASTITQQLAKNLWLGNRRSWLRKAREARLAWWLERRLSKRRILELYLNVIELGDGVLGVEEAARRYYGSSAAALGAEQAAGLAAAIPSPRRSNPATATGAWRNRRRAILERMARVDWLWRALQRWR